LSAAAAEGTVTESQTSLIPLPRIALFDEVEERHLTLIVTKRGRPVARVVPLSSDEPGSLRGSVLHEHDLISPVSVKWNVRL
jgi:hypothetical protein